MKRSKAWYAPARPHTTNEHVQANQGKSCIRFKKMADLNLDELKKVIQIAEKSPGLIGVGASAK